jgi:hypothetical protein
MRRGRLSQSITGSRNIGVADIGDAPVSQASAVMIRIASAAQTGSSDASRAARAGR